MPDRCINIHVFLGAEPNAGKRPVVELVEASSGSFNHSVRLVDFSPVGPEEHISGMGLHEVELQ